MTRRRAATLAAAALAAVAVFRWRALEMPLERDEGHFAYTAQLMLAGVPPYVGAVTYNPPGVFWAYAATLAAFGRGARAIHLGLLLVNAFAATQLYFLTKRLAGESAAALACALFAVLSMTPAVLGLWFHAEQLAVACALAGLALVAAPQPSPRRCAAAGAWLCAAALMRPPAALFWCCAAVWLGSGPRAWRARGWLALGAAGLGGVGVAALGAQGSLAAFWDGAVVRALRHVGHLGAGEAISLFAYSAWPLAAAASLTWLLAAVGVAAVFQSDSRTRDRALSFGLCGALSVLPGYFRSHYFVLLLPSAALFAALGAAAVERLLNRAAPRLAAAAATVLAAAALAQPLVGYWARLGRLPLLEAARAVYEPSLLVETADVARFVASRTNPNDTVAVFGGEEQIYFYARRRAATRFSSVGAVDEGGRPVSDELQMRREIEAAHPRMAVYVHVPYSWGIPQRLSDYVAAWAYDYLHAGYRAVGWVEIFEGARPPLYVWGDAALHYSPRSKWWIGVFERKS